MATRSQVADLIVAAVLEELRGRKGFDWWFDDMDFLTQQDIQRSLKRVVKAALAGDAP